MHHEIRVRDDMPKIDYCVLTVAGQRVHQMTGGSNVGGVGGTDRADRQEEGDAEEEEALCFFSRCICKNKICIGLRTRHMARESSAYSKERVGSTRACLSWLTNTMQLL